MCAPAPPVAPAAPGGGAARSPAWTGRPGGGAAVASGDVGRAEAPPGSLPRPAARPAMLPMPGASVAAGGDAPRGAVVSCADTDAWAPGAAAAWKPSILSRKPERSTSRPLRWCRATSSTSSFICSNVSKAFPSASDQIPFQRQPGPPQLEARAAVVAVGTQHQEQVVLAGHRADDQGQAVGDHRQLLHLADREIAVVV